ncbi:MAG: hypothetical protein HRU50_08950 [Winogradskyella sp.]|nr:hypothetical protein [Winogradskyella sp.]
MSLKRKDHIEIIEMAFSWLVVMAMFIYGFAKLFQFQGAAETEKMVKDMTGMELMWAFYGYSKPFAITLGIFEIIGGLLILFKPTRLIGCFFTTAILINVIFQDIYFGVHAGVLKAAILYQVLIVLILWFNKDILIKSIKILVLSTTNKQSKIKKPIKIVIAFGLFVVFRVIEYLITIK